MPFSIDKIEWMNYFYLAIFVIFFHNAHGYCVKG
jgi:hypothetical protein